MRSWLAAADRFSDAGEHAAAARLWQAIVQQRPGDADAAWALAAALRANGQLEPAIKQLIEFVRQHPECTDIQSARLDAWLSKLSEPDDLLRLLARMSLEAERDFATDFVLATAAAAVDQHDLAEKLFRAAVDAKADFALAHVVWGRVLNSEYHWDEAKEQARAALELSDRLAAAHFVMAEAHTGLDENDEAEAAFRAALDIKADDPAYAIGLAKHFRRSGDLLAAQRYFQQALTADPTNAEAFESLIDSYLGGGKRGVAQAQFRKAETRDFSDDVLRRARTTLHFARVLFQQEHLDELARQFDEHPDDVETGLKLAAGLYVRNDPDKAFECLEHIVPLAPSDERALTLMARVRTRRLEYAEAIEILEELVRRYPNRATTRLLLAESCMAGFRLDEARREFRHILSTDLTDAARLAHREQLLLSYSEFSDFDEALRLLDEWIGDDVDDSVWVPEKLRVLLLAERTQEALDLAIERLNTVTEKHTTELERLKDLAERYQAAPDNEDLRAEGEKLQTEVEGLWTMLMERRLELVDTSMQASRFDVAEKYIRQWIDTEGNNLRNVEWLVLTLIADKRADEARQTLANFRPMSLGDDVAVAELRAQALAAAGKVDEAAEELRTLIEERRAALTAPALGRIWQTLLYTYLRAGRYDEALTCCDDWYEAVGGDASQSKLTWLTFRAEILQAAGRTAEYYEVAEEALELDPHSAALNNDLGYSWIDEGRDVARATQMIREAVGAEPLRAPYLDSLGWAYYKAGNFDGACEYLSRAARLREGQDAVIYDHLGDAEYRRGQVEVARRHWEHALDLAQKIDETTLAATASPIDRIRAKLEALEQSQAPELAPLAEEQPEEK